MRINSNNLWGQSHFLEADKNVFLDHDSYVELSELHFFRDIRAADEIGELTAEEARKLAEATRLARTLSQEWKDLVWERLSSLS